MISTHIIDKEFVVLNPQKKAFVEEFDSGLYERLDRNYEEFAGHELISCYEFEADWESWESHPHGDEVVILLSGEVSMVFRTASGDSTVELCRQGQYVLVPQGVWHTAKTKTRSKLLFITPGQATQHSENPSA